MIQWSVGVNRIFFIAKSKAIINIPVPHHSKFRRTVFLIINELIKKSGS
jgi:hypothetical protein